MANEQNLRPSEYKFTKEDSAKGGRKSGETKRRRKQLKEAFDVLLSKGFTDRHGNQITGVEALAAKVFQQALDGDLAAAKMIRDTVGEAPVQRIESVEISKETYDEVARLLRDV